MSDNIPYTSIRPSSFTPTIWAESPALAMFNRKTTTTVINSFPLPSESQTIYKFSEKINKGFHLNAAGRFFFRNFGCLRVDDFGGVRREKVNSKNDKCGTWFLGGNEGHTKKSGEIEKGSENLMFRWEREKKWSTPDGIPGRRVVSAPRCHVWAWP